MYSSRVYRGEFMKERYTYGYQNGWNVENEYIADIESLMEGYNAQKDIVNNLRRGPEQEIELATEEEIRSWYVEDGIRMPFDEYLRSYREEEQRRLAQRRQDGVAQDNSYLANLYILTEVKDDLRRSLHQQRRELEFRLAQTELDLEQINLTQRRAPLTDSDTRLRLRDEYDRTFLEMQKLRHEL